MHVGTSLVHIVHPRRFDLWTSKNHWVSSYPTRTTLALKLKQLSFIVDVLSWCFDVCRLIWHGVPPCSFNLNSKLAQPTHVLHSGSTLLPLCLPNVSQFPHLFSHQLVSLDMCLPFQFNISRARHSSVSTIFFSQHTYSLASQNWLIEFQQSPSPH